MKQRNVNCEASLGKLKLHLDKKLYFEPDVESVKFSSGSIIEVIHKDGTILISNSSKMDEVRVIEDIEKLFFGKSMMSTIVPIIEECEGNKPVW